MGKRTNTILQSAFFALANVMPAEEAIKYMKDAADALLPEEGPGRRGHEPWTPSTRAPPRSCKVDVPAAWADAADDADARSVSKAVPKLVQRSVKIMLSPSAAWTATACRFPPSSIYADGQFEQGAAAYEKRGVAVTVPHWDADEVHPVQQLRLRLPACHHPSRSR